MKKVKITALRSGAYQDLIDKYENPIENPCEIGDGDSFISINGGVQKDFVLRLGNQLNILLKNWPMEAETSSMAG